jgi:hypothetical protein
MANPTGSLYESFPSREASKPPEPLPPIEPDDVVLVVWMAVEVE